jgi:prevent-host-death family protein
MRTVNIFKAKSDLSRLVEAVESGAEPEIIIARNGRPAARLVPVDARKRGPRIGVAKTDRDIPPTDPEVDEAIAALFEGRQANKKKRLPKVKS